MNCNFFRSKSAYFAENSISCSVEGTFRFVYRALECSWLNNKNSKISNNIGLKPFVHPLLPAAQQERWYWYKDCFVWYGLSTRQGPPPCTICKSPPFNGHCTNFKRLCIFGRKGAIQIRYYYYYYSSYPIYDTNVLGSETTISSWNAK